MKSTPLPNGEVIERQELRLCKTYDNDRIRRVRWPHKVNNARAVHIVAEQGTTKIDMHELLGASTTLLEVDTPTLHMCGESRFNIDKNSHTVLFPSHVIERRGPERQLRLMPFLATRTGMFCLLHETGHVNYNKEQVRSGEVVPTPHIFPFSPEEQVETDILKPERYASEFARRQIREWRQMGLNVLPGISDAQLDKLGMKELADYMRHYDIPRPPPFSPLEPSYKEWDPVI